MLIVFEGLDKSGKTTQVELLRNKLDVVAIAFPDRKTEIGVLIDKYLKVDNVDPHVLKLLFSANRWEKAIEIKTLLMNGKIVVLDRYFYSGLAYNNTNTDWSVIEKDLPQPDLVFFMDIDPLEAAKRSNYGTEKLEQLDVQKKVEENFGKLRDSNWVVLNAINSKEDIHNRVIFEIEKYVKKMDEIQKERLKKITENFDNKHWVPAEEKKPETKILWGDMTDDDEVN